MSHQIEPTIGFDRQLKKISRKDKNLAKKIITTVKKISKQPFNKGLSTHKVNSRKYGECYSSRVTGDIRIIWDFIDGKRVILMLSVGGHSGKNRVY